MNTAQTNTTNKASENTTKTVNNSDKEKKIKDETNNNVAEALAKNELEWDMKKMFGENPTQEQIVNHYQKAEKYKNMNYEQILESLKWEKDESLKNTAEWLNKNIKKVKTEENKENKKEEIEEIEEDTSKVKEKKEEKTEEKEEVKKIEKDEAKKEKTEAKKEKDEAKKEKTEEKKESKKEEIEVKPKKEKWKWFFGSIKSAVTWTSKFVWNWIKYIPRNVFGTLGLGWDMIGAIPAEMFGGKWSIKKAWSKFTGKLMWDYKKWSK